MQMLRLILFAVVMLALSGLCNGQGRTGFGSTRAQDTSFTKGQLKLEAYSGSGDTTILVLMPNGDVKKVAKTAFGGSYTGGYGIDISGNVVAIDTLVVTQWSDTLSVLATKGDIAAIPVLDTSSLSNRIDERVKYTDTAAMLSPYLRSGAISNVSIPKSSTQTSTAPTQSAVSRLVDIRAATSVGSPYLWLIADTPYVKLSAGNAIDSLFDASGNGRHFGQTTAGNRATFFPNGGLNNNAYAFFDSSATPSKYTSGTITLDTNYTMFIVFKSIKEVPAVNTFFLGSAAASTMGLTQNAISHAAGSQTVTIRTTAYNYVIYEVQRRGRFQNFYLDGVELPRTSGNQTTGAFNWSGLGANFGTDQQYPRIYFHELIAFDSKANFEQTETARNYLFGKYSSKSGSLFTIGDSWVSGAVAFGTFTQRWSTALATATGYKEINQGIPGTVLESVGTPETSNVYDRKQWMPKAPVNKGGYAIVMIGGNDVTRNVATYTPAIYKFQLSTVINTLLSKGWQRSQIIISNQARFSVANRARWDSFANNALAVAREMNVMSLDLNTYFADRIANNGEGTHPTALQSDTISRLMQNVISTGWAQDTAVMVSATTFLPIPNALPYVFTGSTSTWTLPPVIGNSGYYIRISNRGSGTVTVNSNAGGNDIWAYSTATSSYSLASGDWVYLFNNGTSWIANGKPAITAGTNISVTNGAGSVTIGTSATPTFTNITLSGIQEFADNAAALSGGLTVGQPYRTGDNLKIVH